MPATVRISKKEENKNTNINFLFEELSIQQLIDLAIDSDQNKKNELESKEELIKRGYDNIQARIVIKKSCKATISSLEALLKTIVNGNNKEVAKEFKNKFLTSISILDKLQLEWQNTI